jgi:hypothetical protein
MNSHPFDEKMWEVRLALVLDALTVAQVPFLEAHWKANGIPPRITFNGRDETPYPSEDLARLYETAGLPKLGGSAAYYMPLRTALAHVREVLCLHPSLACASKTVFGNDGLQVGILNGNSFTSLSLMIVGQMARHNASLDESFRTSSCLVARKATHSLIIWTSVMTSHCFMALGFETLSPLERDIH